MIVSGSEVKKKKLWETGSLFKTFEDHQDAVISVVFSQDGNMIISSSFDKTIKLWEKTTGSPLKTFEFLFKVCSFCILSNFKIIYC